MTTPAPQCQPMSTLLTLLRTPSYGWSGDAMAIDCSTAEMAADEIDRLTSEIASLRARNGVLEEALLGARQIVHTPTNSTRHRNAADHFQADFDQIRRIIDAALQSSSEARTP